MALPPLSPVAQAYLKHTPPSVTYSRPTKRNSVHWDNKHNLDLAIKENALPEACNNNHNLQKAGSLRVSTLSQEAHLDLGDIKCRGQQRRTPLAAETFIAPQPPLIEHTGSETHKYSLGDHDLVKAARRLDPKENVFEKHGKKQFQWVLSLPAPAGSNLDHLLDGSSEPHPHHTPGEGERRYFGCNLLTWTKSAGKEHQLPGDPEDKYLLLATPIDLKPDQSTTTNLEFTTHQFRILQLDTQNLEMAASQVMSSPLSATGSAYRPSPLSARSAQWSTIAEASEDSDNTLTIDPRHEMKEPLSTIEDSLEELDQLEEDIEAIAAAATQVTLNDRQDKGNRIRGEKASPSSTVAETASPASRPAQRTPAWSGKDEASRRISTSNSTLVAKFDQDVGQAQPAATLRRVARPASLAPPKPIQKTSKPPTIPTFELPGERVARELKEKKAARLSMQANSPKAAEVGSPQRTRSVRSTKPPTVPNFELPGERYSRQKKERLEQRLKDEEEEIRRRRQFKAKPPPSAGAPTVRSTFTSRQRQSTGGQSEQGSSFSTAAESSPKAGASKRQSVTMAPSAVRTASITSASTVSTAARGRTFSIGSSQVSTRATSSSAGSVASGSKRNTMPTEEMHRLKTRGRHVYMRDNKEQEKRDREEAIKLARQKYAQMSRDLAAQSRARKG